MQENERIVRRFIDEVVTAGNGATAWPRYLPESGDGTERFRQGLATLHAAFPDLRYTVRELRAEEDRVIVGGSAQATHRGDFRGVAPTDRPVTIEAGLVFRLEDGKIAEARFQPPERPIRQQVLEQAEAATPWYQGYSGGAWEAEGNRQLRVLREHGLRSDHYLLDIGCGTLRGGVKLIPYLEPGHYYGVEADAESLTGAGMALREAGLEDRGAHIVQMDDWNFASFARQFDYMLAYSVFTEIPLNDIIRCLMNVERTLAPEGTLLATFWENAEGKRNLEPIRRFQGLWTYFDQYPYHYDVATFEWICSGTGLQVQYLGPWAGQGPQSLLAFRRTG